MIYNSLLIMYFSNIRIWNKRMTEIDENKRIKMWKIVLIHSHHEEDYIRHEVKIKDRYFCAGCFGGVIGLSICEIPSILYILNFGKYRSDVGIILLIMGFLFIFFSTLKHLVPLYGLYRLISNSFLPLGMWLLIIGSDIFFKNLYTIFFTTFLVIYFIILRMAFSSISHKTHNRKISFKNSIQGISRFVIIGIITVILTILIEISKY